MELSKITHDYLRELIDIHCDTGNHILGLEALNNEEFLDELYYSTFITPSIIKQDTIPVFTDLKEYNKNYPDHVPEVHGFAYYLSQGKGLIINPSSEAILIEQDDFKDKKIKHFVSSATINDYYSIEMVNELANNVLNINLLKLIQDDMDLRDILNELKNSYLFVRACTGNESDDIIDPDDSDIVLVSDLYDYLQVYTGLSELEDDVEYVMLMDFNRLIETVILNGLKGLIVNPLSNFYHIHKPDLLEYYEKVNVNPMKLIIDDELAFKVPHRR